jgi:nucleotide-binding universal stress UspA family protein
MSPSLPGSVLVGVDGSPAAFHAVTFAAGEAASRGRALRLVYALTPPVYVHAPWAGGTTWDVAAARAVGTDVLAQGRACALAVQADLEIATDIIDGSPGEVLIDASREATLTVVGRRGGGEYSSLLLGSAAVQVATYSSGPVLIVPEFAATPAPGGPGVVLGVDHGENGERAVGYAFDEATRRGVPLTAVHGWTLLSGEPAIRSAFPGPDDLQSEQRRLLSEALAGWGAKYPDVQVRPWLVRRHAAAALADAGRGCELMVIGARGSGGFAGLHLGSVADAVIRHSGCPLAVVR